ncbi:DUF6924 domain-containing protein [Microbacterium sp. P03]|uniref:DUF6924 domain-containing protein n=1 Tax=Microbacterium sp. P03 TaxID=3366946 RepID=UPI003745EA25
MQSLPLSSDSLLVRTSRSMSAEWRELLAVIGRENADGFRAYVQPVDHRRWYGQAADAIRAAVPPSEAAVLFVADETTLGSPDLPVLAIQLNGDESPFRAVAKELWSVENNLNLANMDWHEFADAVDDEGIYRGLT